MLSREIERRMGEAAEAAKKARHEFITIEHVLLALTDGAATSELLRGVGANVPELRKELKSHIKKHCPEITPEQLGASGGYETWQPEFTLACHRWLQRAALQVRNAGRSEMNIGHLLIALFFEQDSHAVFLLSQQGVSQFDLINFVSHGQHEESPLATGTEDEDGNVKSLPGPQGEGDTKQSPLEMYCVNLNEKVLQGKVDPLIGRQEIIERALQVLCRRTKNNPLLIGEPGVGKTAIAEGLAGRIVRKEVPALMQDKVIFALDMGSLLAGTKFRGDFEARLKGVVKDAQKRKNVILFIDEIHTLVGAGATSGGSMDASNLLKPGLSSGELSCMGSTTHQEFRQHFEKDRALARRFQRIDVNEPSPEETVRILQGLRPSFESHHGVKFSDEALQSAVDLSIKHLHGRLLPDKALDVIDEAGARARLLDRSAQLIGASEIEEVIAKIAQIPVASLSLNDKDQLKSLEMNLKSVIFGQDEAIERVVAAIKFSRSGLGRENKPIGSFLFAGPTGVGKTEVSRQLALQLGIPIHRFDLSEYMEKHSVARLIGAPPGYVGHEEGGQLTEAVNRSPHCVLLLDEIEKAHPDIFSVLLQVMDAGRLTDSMGRTTNFRQCVIVLTTNAGALEVAKGAIGIAGAPTRSLSLEAIKKTFAPEFINRLDAVVTFNDLQEDVLRRVTRKFVDELRLQLQKKKVDLQITEPALEFVRKKGTDPVYGARPMARTIDELLKKPLVDEVLFGRLANGGRVNVDLKDEALSFHIEN